MTTHHKKLAAEFSIAEKQVIATVNLLDEGATVPFISRYRKELTGSLDEVQVAAIRDRVQQLRELDKRREAILKSLADMDKLTPELEKQVNEAETMMALAWRWCALLGIDQRGREILKSHESDRLVSKPTMIEAARTAVALAEGN